MPQRDEVQGSSLSPPDSGAMKIGPHANGLSSTEAAARLRTLGPNEAPRRVKTALGIAFGVVREPMFLLLAGAAGLYFAVGDHAEGAIMVAAAGLSIGLVVVQQVRSERALEALKALSEPTARAVRDGAVVRIPARDLVPGDLVILIEGDRVPADAILVEGGPLRADESALTGESAPVTKTAAWDDAAKQAAAATDPGADETAALFAGSMIVGGQGAVEVSRIGGATHLGRIGASLASIEATPSPLQVQTERIVKVLGVAALAFCAVVAIAYGFVRGEWFEGGLAGLTLAIALIPEEFPMVLVIFLALGAWRLSRLKVLTRRSAAVEALGAVSALCVDKTGTLTENRMRVAETWSPGEAFPTEVRAGASRRRRSDAHRGARLRVSRRRSDGPGDLAAGGGGQSRFAIPASEGDVSAQGRANGVRSGLDQARRDLDRGRQGRARDDLRHVPPISERAASRRASRRGNGASGPEGSRRGRGREIRIPRL